LLKAARIPVRKAAVATPALAMNSAAPPAILSLVRQIFFPAAAIRRTQVLFAAADAGTKVVAVCEQAGRALAEMSGATVAIMEASPPSASAFNMKRNPGNAAGAEWWRSSSLQIAENLWRVPSALLSNRSCLANPERWIGAESGGLLFDYVLLAAVVTDSETPAFCNACDGAVLVLTANRTRRESALRAREYLLHCNAELLGTVLDGRTYPVPEAIYRRL
jgi:hypothetical protein